MIFHCSIAADDPKRTAEFLAELWGGRAYPFPPVGKGSWVAMAGDERNSTIEVYARGLEAHPGEDDAPVREVIGAPVRNVAFHAAIATALSIDEVKEIAGRYDTAAKVCNRGPFGVIEVWIDGCQMLEVLTPEMQAQYLRGVTIEGWEAFLAATASPAEAA
jgi:hypothetical protein